MPLAARAAVAIPAVPGVPQIFCHVATWFYAAREAQALGLSANTTPAQTIQNIAGMNPGAQPAMTALAQKAGTWDFNHIAATPPDGSVLYWEAHPTHSATVTGNLAITGYNQGVQWLGAGLGHTTNAPANLVVNQKVVKVISEATIVARAAALAL